MPNTPEDDPPAGPTESDPKMSSNISSDSPATDEASQSKLDSNPQQIEEVMVDIATAEPAGTSTVPSMPKPAKETERKAEEKAGAKSFLRILSYGSKLDWIFLAIAGLGATGAGAAMPLMTIFFGRMVNNFSSYSVPGSSTSGSEFRAEANSNALYMVYLFIGKFVLDYISVFTCRMSGIRISASIRKDYLASLFALSISAVDKLPPGYATDALGTAANTIQLGISEKLSILVQSIATTIVAYAISFSYSWALTLAMSSALLLFAIIYPVCIGYAIKLEAAINHSRAKSSAVAGEVLKSVRTMKSLCAEDAILQRYNKWIDEARKTGLKKTPLAAAFLAPQQFAIFAAMALALWLGVKLYLSGSIDSVGDIVV